MFIFYLELEIQKQVQKLLLPDKYIEAVGI